jgi:hypothetical protein
MRIVVDSPLDMELANSLFQPPRRCQISLFERGESMKRLAFTILWSTILFGATSSAETSPIRVLLLDGQSAGTYHNWQLTHPIMKGLPHVWMHASDELYATLRDPGKDDRARYRAFRPE